MVILTQKNKQIEYLINSKRKPILKLKQEFIKDFNKEADKGCDWFAEIIGFGDKGEDYQFLHISKYEGKIIYNKKISLHIITEGQSFSFNDNDFISGEFTQGASDKFFKYFPEFKKVLENIPQVFFLLKKSDTYKYNKYYDETMKDLREFLRGI